MNRIFQKIPVLMVVLLGVYSMSITAFAYYAYNYGVEVSTIQTAEYAVHVGIQNEGTESSLTSYTFSGSEGEAGVTFCLTATGTETAVGCCEIVFKDQSYYTNPIEVGDSMTLVIKGNEGAMVSFVSHWGTLDVPESAVLISGEGFVIEATEATEVTETTESSEEVAIEPTEESREEAATEPTEEPSEEPATEPTEESSDEVATEPTEATEESSATEEEEESTASLDESTSLETSESTTTE